MKRTEAAPPTPEQLAMEAAQKSIRACVLAEDRLTYFTWYHGGNVVVVTNGEAEQAGRAYNVAGFNALLERHGVVGLRGKGAWKVSERLPEHG